MIRQIALTDFKSRDTVHLSAYKNVGKEGTWLELRIWDDYEGRGGSAGLYKIEEVDQLIASLVEIRKELV